MEKIKAFIEKVKYTFRSICDTIRNIKEEIDFYKGIWEDPRGNTAVRKTASQMGYLLRKMKPSKTEGDVTFGMGDPAITGQILGAIAMIYGVLPEKLNITPDFENRRFQGNIHMKGKIRLIHVVVAAVRLISDKNFRYVVKKVLAKEDGNNEQQ